MNGYEVELVSTAAVPPDERADYWCHVVSSYHRKVAYLDLERTDVHARAVRQWTSRYQLAEWQQDRVWLERSARHIREDDDGDYRLAVPLDGELLVRQQDVASHLRGGAGVLYTVGQPFSLGTQGPTRGLVLTLPRADLTHRLGSASPDVAASIELRQGLGRVVLEMLIGLSRERDKLTGGQFNAACERLVELVCLLLDGGGQPAPASVMTDIVAMARRYVQDNAADPDLRCDEMARQLGWSLRQVQRALREAGTTPQELIREERLRLARSLLESPRWQHRTIAEVALACGFASHSALSRAFRRQYGISPSDLR